jgi:outer membrane scaffolding protein for murein synthesis (MipA/OmpV family)
VRAFRSTVSSTLALAALTGISIVVAPGAATAQSVPAESATPPDPAVGGDSVTVGVAAAYVPDYEGSNNYRLVPGPAAIGSIKGFSFQVLGNRASVDLIPNRPGPNWDIQLGPVAVVNFNRTSGRNIDDPRVRALPDRDTAIELGGYVGIGKTGVITSPYDRLSATVSYRHDVSGVHDSGIWTPSISYLTPLSLKAAAGLTVSADRVERGYGREYFDVTAADSLNSGLPVYRARGGWKSYTIGAFGTYSLTGNLLHGFKLVAGGTYKRMINDYGDSPVTSVAGSRDQWLGAVGLAYTF